MSVLAGGLVAGTLDITYACVFWALRAGTPPQRIFQSVAKGVLGPSTFKGGAATAALGRPHRVEGVVVHGDHRGRDLGFPTANIASAAWTALPADGVYAGHFVLGERRLPSAISVGTNPTFSGRERTVEVYVLDVDEDFYGFDVGVDVEHWLRGQERFDDIDALRAQMRADVDRARALLDP